MNSSVIVLTVFGVWSLICWNWYVCGIKQQCGEKQPVEEVVAPVPNTAYEDTAAQLPSGVSQAPLRYDYESTEQEKVQIIQYDDRVEIHFPYQSARRIEEEAVEAYLDNLAAQLRQSNAKIRIEGHADFVGGGRYNKTLGLQRAQNIQKTLIQKGVSKSQIDLRSYGDTKPIATNDTPEGRYTNRRVEIRVIQ